MTGATGFIGRAMVPHLVDQGYDVSILVQEGYAKVDERPLPPALTAVRAHIQLVYADLRNFRLVCRAVRQAAPDAVLHLAAKGVTDPFLGVDTAVRHNVSGTLNLIRACFEKTFTTQKMIIARTPGERSQMNVYAASKAAAWEFARMYANTQQWPILGAMIFQAYGPHQPERTLIPAALAAAQTHQDFPMTAGLQKRDWIYVSDVVAGLLATLNAPMKPGQTVELGSGQLTSVVEVVRLIYRLTGSAAQPKPGVLPSRPGEDDVQTADAEETFALIGWRTAVSLEAGLAKLIQATV